MPKVAPAFQREAARLLVQHIYRTGLRQEWLQEDEEAEAVVMRLTDGARETLVYPPNRGYSGLFATLEELEASVSRICQWKVTG